MASSRQVGGASTSSADDFHADTLHRHSRYSTLGPVFAFLSCVLFSCNSELLQFVQRHDASGDHVSPLLNLILCHLGGLVFAPWFLFWKPSGGKPGMNVPLGSLCLAALLMVYNYAWLLSTRYLAASLTNAIFQTSVAFVYLASIVIFKAKFEGLQLLGVAFALVGAFLASGLVSSSTPASQNIYLGIFLALCASVGCMIYQVTFKYFYGHFKNDARFLAHIGAWVGIWHITVILPLAGLAHVLGFEQMQFPQGHLAVGATLASACIASMVNAMYICMVMWGSLMLLPCASALTVPLTVALDMVIHHVVPARLVAFGQIMIVLSVGLIMGFDKVLLPRTKTKLDHDYVVTPRLAASA